MHSSPKRRASCFQAENWSTTLPANNAIRAAAPQLPWPRDRLVQRRLGRLAGKLPDALTRCIRGFGLCGRLLLAACLLVHLARAVELVRPGWAGLLALGVEGPRVLLAPLGELRVSR